MANRIPILMYHQVGDFPAPRSPRAIHCHYKRFAVQMAYLYRFSYNVISMDRVAELLSGSGKIPPRTVALTFDDGYENFFQYAFPVLQRYAFPAMVYLVSGLIGKRATWLTRDRSVLPPLLDAGQILQLKHAGIDFGSHGINHIKLAEVVGTDRMLDELRHSKEELESLLDEEVRHLCYPYGSHNRQVVEGARATGYQTAVTCVRAFATLEDDLLALPRKTISYNDNLASYVWKLHVASRGMQRPYVPAHG